MSIGNTKDVGNKGNNFPYQRSVLELLGSIAKGGGSSGPGTSVTRIPSLLRVTGAGAATIAAGTRSVSVYNAGITNGTWLGAVIKPGESFGYSASSNDVLSLFTYNALTTELVITTVI